MTRFRSCRRSPAALRRSAPFPSVPSEESTSVPSALPEGPSVSEVSGAVKALLLREAEQAGPEEACGLLVGVRRGARVVVTRAVPCENSLPSSRRTRRFAIDPRRVIHEERAARASSEEVVGFYHSHPVGEPVPSSVDRGFMALWPDVVWVIVAPRSERAPGRIRAWAATADPSGSPREVPIDMPPRPEDGGRRRARQS